MGFQLAPEGLPSPFCSGVRCQSFTLPQRGSSSHHWNPAIAPAQPGSSSTMNRKTCMCLCSAEDPLMENNSLYSYGILLVLILFPSWRERMVNLVKPHEHRLMQGSKLITCLFTKNIYSSTSRKVPKDACILQTFVNSECLISLTVCSGIKFLTPVPCLC